MTDKKVSASRQPCELKATMILELTEKEQVVLLGIIEDESQEEDVRDVYTMQDIIAIKSIIQKLGGTFFGNL